MRVPPVLIIRLWERRHERVARTAHRSPCQRTRRMHPVMCSVLWRRQVCPRRLDEPGRVPLSKRHAATPREQPARAAPAAEGGAGISPGSRHRGGRTGCGAQTAAPRAGAPALQRAQVRQRDRDHPGLLPERAAWICRAGSRTAPVLGRCHGTGLVRPGHARRCEQLVARLLDHRRHVRTQGKPLRRLDTRGSCGRGPRHALAHPARRGCQHAARQHNGDRGAPRIA